MTSKRELEGRIAELEVELAKVDRWRRNSIDNYEEAVERLERCRLALGQVAKLHGFYDAYTVEEVPAVGPSGAGRAIDVVFSPTELIADLDVIVQARSADEARARLGIGGDREGE